MSSPCYTIRKIGRRLARGRSEPMTGLLAAILKAATDEDPYAVYNEYVAVRLGQALSLPIVDGVLVSTSVGTQFASLSICETDVSLPEIHRTKVDAVVRLFPAETAATLAFDAWIGNIDRATNVKATTAATCPVRIYRVFDHATSLLGCCTDARSSIRALKEGRLFVDSHPFLGKVSDAHLRPWVERIQGLSADQIAECCSASRPLDGATMGLQKALAEALCARRILLSGLLKIAEGDA